MHKQAINHAVYIGPSVIQNKEDKEKPQPNKEKLRNRNLRDVAQ